ncbi:MAG TPA: caspase family protein, partial [Saprospiraceae bacterium]|nr:caspase family protein [Saprospiraceae bacterium]
FKSLDGTVQHNKNITVKAILVSDKPVAVDQVVLLRNRNEPIPVAQNGRLVLLQSEDHIFVYKLYCPVALQRGPNAFSLQATNASGIARAKDTPSIEYQAPESNLYVYSIGVPLAEEGLQYSVSDAGKFGSLLRQNKEGGYFKHVESTVITDPELTKYYKFRKILIDIRERAKLGQFKPEDLLLVYVSSQSTDKVKGSLKIKASNYDGVEVETTAVDYEDFFMYFLDDPIIICRKMLILDVFSAKPVSPGQEEESEGEDPVTLSNTLNTLQAQQKNLITLMACSPNENSYEDPSWGNSALIAAMAQLFAGNNLELADTNRDKELTLNELYSFLRTRVPELLKKSGARKATTQTPFIPGFDARKSDFTIFAY